MSASPCTTARPLATDALTPSREISMPRPSTPRVLQQPQQFAVAAADVEHARAGRHHVGDQQMIDAHVAVVAVADAPDAAQFPVGLVEHHLRPASPRAGRRPRKPRTMANSSGSSSRNASWPLSVTISANDTRAAPALSACTMARIPRREQPVRSERDDAEARLGAAESIREHAVIVGSEIEIVHRARQIEIAVGIEALDERRALITQIALDLEIGVEPESRVVAVLKFAAELPMQRHVRQIGDVRGHARHARPRRGLVPSTRYFPPRQSGSAITA